MNASILGLSKKDIDEDLRRDRRVLRAREVHRHAGAALLVGHVRAARVRGGGQRRPRHPARRRGALRRRRSVPTQVHRAGQAVPGRRAARSCSSRTRPTSCAGSATAASCSTTARWSTDAAPGEAVRVFRETLARRRAERAATGGRDAEADRAAVRRPRATHRVRDHATSRSSIPAGSSAATGCCPTKR